METSGCVVTFVPSYQPEELAGLAVTKLNMQQREEKTLDKERCVENIK